MAREKNYYLRISEIFKIKKLHTFPTICLKYFEIWRILREFILTQKRENERKVKGGMITKITINIQDERKKGKLERIRIAKKGGEF